MASHSPKPTFSIVVQGVGLNKIDAYKLLSEELNTIRDLGLDGAIELLSKSNEFIKKSNSGASYCVTIRIVGGVLEGSIHDYNTQNFELLEETLEF